MKTFFKLMLILFVLNSCNSQTLNTEFVNSIPTSVRNFVVNNKVTQGKISITYPTNLSSKFQKIINDDILMDMKLMPCNGIDARIQIRYDIKYNSDVILSVFKVVDYIFCDDNDYSEWYPFNLYVANGNTYKVSIIDTPDVKILVDDFIRLSKGNPETECNYVYEDIYKYLIFNNKQAKLLLVQDNTFCFGESNLNLQPDMIKFEIVN